MPDIALEQSVDIKEHIAALKRRRGLIFSVAGVIFILGLVLAFSWPPTYESTSTILIEEQEVPAELIQSTVTSYAAQRIQVISQRVMTRDNLRQIIQKYELYESERKRKTSEEILREMRDNIGIEMVTADVVDPRTGRPVAATIAFRVGFQDRGAQIAQKVANELTTLYLNENLRTRTEKAEETYLFLSEETSRLSSEISKLEAQLAEFQEKNANLLPQLKETNIRLMERTEREIEAIDASVSALQEQSIYLEGQLALIEPYSAEDVMSPGQRLEALRTQYISASSRYSTDHPSITSLKREIEALEAETGNYSNPDKLQERIAVLKQELDMTLQLYTAEHPDVKNLQRQIGSLEEQLASSNSSIDGRRDTSGATNPAYVTLESQLSANQSEVNALNTKRANLSEKLNEYEERLLKTPQVERGLRALTRDLNNATARYQEIRAKQMTAEVGQELEKERKGERFTLIDPAVVPQEPISPNRPAIIFLSLVLALGAGLGSAAAAEVMSNAVYGAKNLANLVGMAPLAVIPYLDTESETSRQKNRRKIIIASAIVGIIVILLLIHFLFSPLDVLWFRGVRKMENLAG